MISLSRRTLFATAGALLALSAASTAWASGTATTIHVSLWDNGDHAMDQMGQIAPMGMNMGGDMSKATMGIRTDISTVPAGDVTFDVTNDSTWAIHEMIVSPAPAAGQQLPYDNNLMKVNEDAAGHLGEVAELEPGGHGSLTLHLNPGTYILYCNIPGHYIMGMWTTITVTQ